MSTSSAAFRAKIELLLKGEIVPTRLEKQAGAGQTSRVSASVKDKSRVLEGEMGRLSQEVIQLKKLRETLLNVKDQLDYERDHIRQAEQGIQGVVAMVQNSRAEIWEHVNTVDTERVKHFKLDLEKRHDAIKAEPLGQLSPSRTGSTAKKIKLDVPSIKAEPYEYE